MMTENECRKRDCPPARWSAEMPIAIYQSAVADVLGMWTGNRLLSPDEAATSLQCYHDQVEPLDCSKLIDDARIAAKKEKATC